MNIVAISSLDVPPHYLGWCRLANRVNWDLGYERANCISVALALVAFLSDQGLDARPVRVKTLVRPKDRTGSLLGGGRNSEIGWGGHLVVSADGHVFDATLDQVPFGMPLVFPMSPGWDDGESVFLEDEHKTCIRYTRFYRQNGWKSKGAARRSEWEPIYKRMTTM